jgi:tetratricopeptide (TPR) repeat protein
LADISWHAADDSLKNALKQNSEDTFLFITAAELMEVKAEWLKKKGEPFDGEFSRGLSYIEKALKINPKEAEALILQGKFYQLKNSQDLANQSFQKAFAINLNLKRKYQ